MTQSHFAAVLFDLDGTLLDTAPDLGAAASGQDAFQLTARNDVETGTQARQDMQLTRDYLVYLRKTMGAAAP